MKLYHGTNTAALRNILQQRALTPRCERKATHADIPSHPEHVYLSSAYAAFYALSYCGTEAPVVIEVGVADDLPKDDLYPDEDFVAQALHEKHEMGIVPLTEYVRDSIESFKRHWVLSLERMGSVAVRGSVALHTQTRIAIIDPSYVAPLIMRHYDPMPTILNYRVRGDANRRFHEDLFDSPALDRARIRVESLAQLALEAQQEMLA